MIQVENTHGKDRPQPTGSNKFTQKLVAAVGVSILTLSGMTACNDAAENPKESPQAEQTSGQQPANECGNAPGEMRSTEAKGPGANGAVSTSEPTASWAACQILAHGGNATDAAIAAQLMLGLTEPQSSGPGGGALAVHIGADGQQIQGMDGTAFSPADYKSDDSDVARVGVPQTLNMMRALHDQHGSLSLEEVAAPAIKAAEEGFVVSQHLVDSMDRKSDMLGDNGLLHTLYDVEALPAVGDELKNPSYAETIRTWADNNGELTAELLATFGKDISDQTPGDTGQRLARTWADRRSDMPEFSDALCGGYAQWNLCGVDSNAVGTNVVLTAMGILNHEDMQRFEPYENKGVPVAKATAAHFVTEAERIAFADANAWMGDPGSDETLQKIARDYRTDVVTNDKAHKKFAKQISQKKSLADIEPTNLGDGEYSDFIEEGTSHVSVRDGSGETLSLTSTLGKEFGAGLHAGGFFLNNSLDNFTPGSADRPNSARPLVHPKTMMAPLIAKNNEGDVVAIGSPGGNYIPSYNIKAALGVLAWNLDPKAAIRMPNFGATTRKGAYVEKGTDPRDLKDMDRMKARLEDWGHGVRSEAAESGLGVLVSRGDSVTAGADHRRGGVALVSGPP